MNKQQAYIIFLFVLIALYAFVELTKPKPLNLTDSFTNFDTIPLGSLILFEQLPVLFPDQDISTNEATLFEQDSLILDEENWIFINSGLSFDNLDSEILLDHVNNGGVVFMAGRSFSGLIADTLKVSTEFLPFYFKFLNSDTTRNINMELAEHDIQASFDPRFISHNFRTIDTTRTEILGRVEGVNVNFIRVSFGEGYFYLHSNPEIFTNYFTRDVDFTDYIFATLSYLPVRNTIWDEYYKAGRKTQASPMYVILDDEYLRWAWILGLATILLYFFFRSKRLQRIIPVLRAPRNSSIEFASTIAQLYFERKSHKDIALKRIKFLLEQLRNNYRLDTNEISEYTRQALTERSGLLRRNIDELFDTVDYVQNLPKVTDKDLILLNEKIDYFYKNSLR